MTTRTDKRASADGRGSQDLRLEPPEPARRTQVPQLVVAVFLVALFALLAVVGYTQATARDAVVALAVDVSRGEAITPEMLQVVYLSTDDAIPFVAPDASSAFLGLRAIADLSAGTLVTAALFVDNTALDAGEAVVGLALGPGEYPSPFLSPGDHVTVVRTVRDSSELSAAIGDVASRPSGDNALETTELGDANFVLVVDAVVFDVSPLGTQGELFISLRLSDEDAPVVAAADAAGAVRLVQVPVPEQP